ncbi:MAG: L,D-transpeptidase family protein [Thermodesulfobacteriota bacterium]
MAQPQGVITETIPNPDSNNVKSGNYDNSELHNALKIALRNNYIVVNNKKFSSSPLLNKFYKSRNYDLAWFKKNLKPRKELFTYLKVLQNSKSEGLDPNSYYLDNIETNINDLKHLDVNDLKRRVVQVDLLVSDSNLLYFNDLLFGRYNFSNNFMEQNYSEPYIDLVTVTNTAITKNNFQQAVNSLLPQSYVYNSLKKSLVKYQKIQENGGWQTVPSGKTLKVGMNNSRIVFLKHRLHATGDLTPDSNQSTEQYLNSQLFDNNLDNAVKNFQRRHGLNEDGEVGKNTVAALNIPIDQKIDSIMINMDIWRKLPQNLGNKYVLVNVPAFKLFGVENNTTSIEMRVIVGRLDWNTPIFSEYMEYVVINPYWNIPSSIFEDEILPELRKDPEYLQKKKIQVVSLETARVQKNYSENWSDVNPNNFNYRLRQVPGAANPLGRLKFILPNKHSVYLHDTPDKKLFSRSNRRFSHGCIRVEKPLQLAEFVFNENDDWNANRVQSEIDTGASKNVYLKQPIPVHIMYFTVWIENDDSVHFRNDVYNFLSTTSNINNTI